METYGERKAKCEECDWTGHMADVLTAPNPFCDTDEIMGCPKCKAVKSITYACDEPGCWADVSCGTPTATGYRTTCGKHRPEVVSTGSDSQSSFRVGG